MCVFEKWKWKSSPGIVTKANKRAEAASSYLFGNCSLLLLSPELWWLLFAYGHCPTIPINHSTHSECPIPFHVATKVNRTLLSRSPMKWDLSQQKESQQRRNCRYLGTHCTWGSGALNGEWNIAQHYAMQKLPEVIQTVQLLQYLLNIHLKNWFDKIKHVF